MCKLFAFLFVLCAPMFGGENGNIPTMPTGCEVSSYGITGKQLPALLKDATKALPKGVEIATDQVVLIEDFDRWASCQRIKTADATWIRNNLLAFSVRAEFPIYVIGEHKNIKQAIEYYGKGVIYLKYTFAVWFSHEWEHAYLHESGEVPAYTFEVKVLEAFLKEGKLPPECRADLVRAQARLEEAKAGVNGIILAKRE